MRISGASFGNAALYVYGGQAGHPPPHVHLRGPDSRCTIDLATLEVTRGAAHRRDLRQARAWLSDPHNLARVLNEWRRLNERG